MRRAILALGSTIAGIVVLLSFKTHSLAAAGAPAAAPSTPSGTGSSAPASGSAGAGSAGAADAAGPAGATGKARPATGRKHRTVVGRVAETARGPMQVELTLAGRRITRVTMLQRTDDGPLSNQIDANAIPQLINETLTAQSAHIDAVSGATYTSEGYLQSLQSALDKIRA